MDDDNLSKKEKDKIEKINNEGVNSEFVMVPLIVVLTLITIWFFYLRFFISFMKRKKLVWVEVQDFKDPEYSVTRNEAKRNLHMICEMTQKLRSVANLFDKYWYR
jgi:hypothetical protein